MVRCWCLLIALSAAAVLIRWRDLVAGDVERGVAMVQAAYADAEIETLQLGHLGPLADLLVEQGIELLPKK